MNLSFTMSTFFMFRKVIVIGILIMNAVNMGQAQEKERNTKVRLGIAGLTHGHVHWIMNRMVEERFEIVGISEPNKELAKGLSQRYGFSMDLVYTDLEDMVESTKPEGVLAFNSIKGHLDVVRTCAPEGIHVMVEKPLAASLADALEIKRLTEAHDIHVLTNYETSWFATTHLAYQKLNTQGTLGEVRKMVVHDGHQGPKEIGVGPEFLEWLTDPDENGGGAVIDFGCYGANIMTWLLKGQRPLDVQGTLQQIKPDIYPDVDDEATIVLRYPNAQGIIQASWNWPYSRKDVEVYGTDGALICEDGTRARMVDSQGESEVITLEVLRGGYADPFTQFSEIIRGNLELPPYDLLSLENNLIVMEILDAAIRSSKEGKTISLDRND